MVLVSHQMVYGLLGREGEVEGLGVGGKTQIIPSQYSVMRALIKEEAEEALNTLAGAAPRLPGRRPQHYRSQLIRPRI